MSTQTAFLGEIEIFSSLQQEELAELEAVLQAVELPADSRLFREGDPGDELFLVRSGRVSVTVNVPGGEEVEVAEFGPGQFFGEMSIFDHAPRSANCSTSEDTSLLSMKGVDFDRLLSHHPRIAVKVMYRMLGIISERLQNSSEFLSEMVQWGEDARRRAITDEFTGLFNRRFLDQAIEEQFAKHKAARKPLSVIMFDLDHFRNINETYSPEVGDRVIKAVVPVLRRVLREHDLAARFGGDEFCVILPDTVVDEACRVGKAIVEGIRALPVLRNLDGPIVQVTSSVGVATLSEGVASAARLRELADEALYQAKEEGRDRAVCAGGRSGGAAGMV